MSEDTKSRIAELEKGLYSKDFKEHQIGDVLPRQATASVPDWSPAGEEEKSFLEGEANRHRTMKKFVIISVSFFVVAMAVAAFIWWRGSNIISGENITINIDHPLSVSGGDPFDTKFTVTNDNKVAVDAATLLVEYPVGFYSSTDNTDLPRISKDLGPIAPGQSLSQSVSSILYGEENTKKEVMVTLEYRMSGSNATLSKTTSYSVGVLSSPVNVKLSLPKETSSGQEVDFSVEIGSNTKNIISSLVVSIAYPTGFTFESSSVTPTYDTNVWVIPSLVPQGKRVINIRGVIEGQEGDEKAIRVSVGTQNQTDQRLVGIVYNATTESSIITKPFLALDFSINNNTTQNAVAAPNRAVRVDVLWKSNNPTKIMDAGIEVVLKGAALNKYSIYASNGGFYRSVDNTIVWEKMGNPELSSIDPGANGVVSFSFSPISLGADLGSLIKNPQILFEIRAHASQIGGSTASRSLSTRITRSIKFETELKTMAAGWFFSGPFQNIGPMPPQADHETTYTITLSARSSVNNVSNVTTKTTLPIYVKWLNVVSPQGEDVTFNEATSEVTWNVPRLPAGGAREASFQISFTPSISQIGRSPALTGDIVTTATDDFTKTNVSDKKSPVTIYLFSDPQFSANDASVVN